MQPQENGEKLCKVEPLRLETLQNDTNCKVHVDALDKLVLPSLKIAQSSKQLEENVDMDNLCNLEENVDGIYQLEPSNSLGPEEKEESDDSLDGMCEPINPTFIYPEVNEENENSPKPPNLPTSWPIRSLKKWNIILMVCVNWLLSVLYLFRIIKKKGTACGSHKTESHSIVTPQVHKDLLQVKEIGERTDELQDVFLQKDLDCKTIPDNQTKSSAYDKSQYLSPGLLSTLENKELLESLCERKSTSNISPKEQEENKNNLDGMCDLASPNPLFTQDNKENVDNLYDIMLCCAFVSGIS